MVHLKVSFIWKELMILSELYGAKTVIHNLNVYLFRNKRVYSESYKKAYRSSI